MDKRAYTPSEKVFLAPYEIRNFENAFSVIHMATTAETSKIATLAALEAETETTRKSGQNVPKVWNPTTCRKNASTNAAAVSERTNPTNDMGNPA
jgi:hypothetical protein